MTAPSPELIVVGAVGEVKSNADNLDLTWALRPATVDSFSGSTLSVIMDGDTITVPAISLLGYVPAGTRVMIMNVPPSGLYAIAPLSYTNDSAYTDYAMVTTSSGTPPSVGSGSQGGRWTVLKHKTILFEGFVLFGAGMSQGTGRYFFPTPFNCSTDGFAATGSGYIFDSGIANRGAFAVNFTSSHDQVFLTNTPSGDVGAGIPQGFVSGDQILFSIVYEVDSF